MPWQPLAIGASLFNKSPLDTVISPNHAFEKSADLDQIERSHADSTTSAAIAITTEDRNDNLHRTKAASVSLTLAHIPVQLTPVLKFPGAKSVVAADADADSDGNASGPEKDVSGASLRKRKLSSTLAGPPTMKDILSTNSTTNRMPSTVEKKLARKLSNGTAREVSLPAQTPAPVAQTSVEPGHVIAVKIKFGPDGNVVFDETR